MLEIYKLMSSPARRAAPREGDLKRFDMKFFKPKGKKLTEAEVGELFVFYIMKAVDQAWPTIYDNLKSYNGFSIKDEKAAKHDLAFAMIAGEMAALENVFLPDQAKRIEGYIFDCLNFQKWGTYAVEEIVEYRTAFQREYERVHRLISMGHNPEHAELRLFGAIPERLLRRWLGENITAFEFEIEIDGKKTKCVDRVFVTCLSAMIPILGILKKLIEDFKIIEGSFLKMSDNPKFRSPSLGASRLAGDDNMDNS